MKLKYIISFTLLVPFYSTTATAMQSIKKYVPFLSKKEATASFSRELPFTNQGAITVKNSNGTITVKAWNQDKINISAVKHAASQDQLSAITINVLQTSGSVNIATACKEKCTVDYTILAPPHCALTASTETGAIAITGIKGKINATTEHGDITTEHTSNTVVAHAQYTGSISAKQAKQNVKATTNKGNITVSNSHSSVLATADNGNIDVKTEQVPSTSKIKLTTNNGLITVCLPHDVDADLQANTKRGSIISQHAITIKPKTTTLDAQAWKQFKKQVDGILGSGEATIVLNTNKGNIKILNEKKA